VPETILPSDLCDSCVPKGWLNTSHADGFFLANETFLCNENEILGMCDYTNGVVGFSSSNASTSYYPLFFFWTLTD